MSHKDILNKIKKEFNENDFKGEEEYSNNIEDEKEENNQNYLYDYKCDFNNNYGSSGENEENEKNNEDNNTESQNEENSSYDKENEHLKYHSNNFEGEESFRPKPQPPSPEFGTMEHININENSKNEGVDKVDTADNIKKTIDTDNLVENNNKLNIDNDQGGLIFENNNINTDISPSSSEERREKEFLMREERKIKEKRENNKRKDNNERKKNIIEEKKEEDKKEEQQQKEKENNQIAFTKNEDDKKINESQKKINKDINICNNNINIIEKEEKEEKYTEDRITSSNENSSFIPIKEMTIKSSFQNYINEENNQEYKKEYIKIENENESNKNGQLRILNNNINSGKNNFNIQNSQNGYLMQKNNKNNSNFKGIDTKNENNNKFQLKYPNYIENKKKAIFNFENGLTNINIYNNNKMKYYKNKRIYFKKCTNKNYPSKFQMKSRIKKQKSNSKNSKREVYQKKTSFTPDEKEIKLSDKNRINKDNHNSKLLSRNKNSINDIGLYRKKSSNLNNERICKKIDNVINEYTSEDGLSIVNVVQILFDLKIINELIRNINQKANLNIKEMKKIVNNIKKKDYKKLEELEFLDQLWFTINPSLNEYINTKFFYEFLKLMLSSEKKFLNGDLIKDLSLSIENLLNQNYYNNDSSRSYNTEIFISPLSNKKYDQTDLWSVPKLVKMFFKLKSHINNEFENKKNEMIYSKEEEDKELTFKPNLKESNDYFQIYSKFNYYNYNNIDNSGKKKNDFNKIYDRFMREKANHDKTIEKMREIKLMKENKKCTHIPKINKYYPRSQEKMNGALDKDKNIPIYERLYNLSQINNENSSLKRSKTADIIPNNLSSNEIKKKSQYNYNKKNILKNGQLINEEENQNRIFRDRIYGKNDDEFQNMKKPMNNTYLNNNNKNNKKMNINNEQNDIIDNVFITIEIKINNGQLKPLKIYKNQSDSNEMVNNFCKMYNISEEDKKIIINNVKYYQKVFFKENINN